MNYIVYDISERSPSLAERDIIWSVLLWGERIQITSNMALPFLVYGEFPHYTEQQKFDAYEFFKPMVETVITWAEFDFAIKHILHQRRKKNKTGIEVKDLASREVWLRKTEKWFLTSLRDNLTKYNYEEIVPLSMRYDDKMNPDVSMIIAKQVLNTDDDAVAEDHFIKIVTDALAQPDSVFLFDERIEPFIQNLPVEKIAKQTLPDNGKAFALSEKLFTIPLCYTLKTNDIQMARNELAPHFKSFHECLHHMATGGDIKKGMENLCSLLPAIQHTIESSNFVLNVRNQLKDVPAVEVYLGFTSTKGILHLLMELKMFDEEQLLQAYDMLSKQTNADSLRTFMFIRHSK